MQPIQSEYLLLSRRGSVPSSGRVRRSAETVSYPPPGKVKQVIRPRSRGLQRWRAALR